MKHAEEAIDALSGAARDRRKYCLIAPVEDCLGDRLVRNRNQSLSYDQIHGEVWNHAAIFHPHQVIWNTVSRLREKLRAISEKPDYIISKRGEGYFFKV